MDKNQLRLDYTNNPDLAELFSRKKVGDSCTVEVDFQVDEITDTGVVGTIKNVSSDDYPDKEAEPEPDKPMMMEMSAPAPA